MERKTGKDVGGSGRKWKGEEVERVGCAQVGGLARIQRLGAERD